VHASWPALLMSTVECDVLPPACLPMIRYKTPVQITPICVAMAMLAVSIDIRSPNWRGLPVIGMTEKCQLANQTMREISRQEHGRFDQSPGVAPLQPCGCVVPSLDLCLSLS